MIIQQLVHGTCTRIIGIFSAVPGVHNALGKIQGQERDGITQVAHPFGRRWVVTFCLMACFFIGPEIFITC